jgi:hypothetical protein
MSSGHPRRRLANGLGVIAALLLIASLVRLGNPESRQLMSAGIASLAFAVMLHISARPRNPS